MFKGTKNMSREKIFDSLDNVGAMYNAETGAEHTMFHIHGHGDYVMTYIDILLDIYANSVYKDKDIETERGVIYEEINVYKNDIQDIMNDCIHKIMFDNSSLKYPTLGTKKTLTKITKKDLMHFRRTFYVPERTVFVIAGSFGTYDKDKILKYITPILEDVQMGNIDHIMPISDPVIQIETRIHKVKYKTTTPLMCICYRSQSIFSTHHDVFDIISHILTSGSSSRLFNALREKLGISYMTYTENIYYQHEGAFCIYAYTDYKTVNKVMINILQEINILVEKGIDEEELNKAKQIKLTSLAMSLQTPYDIMMYHGMNEIDYRVGSVNIDKLTRTKLSARIQHINEIDLHTVNVVIKNLFRPEKLNIFVVGNGSVNIKTLPNN